MNKRQAQKANTRQTIRQTAKELFSQQGFETTTIRQIAKESGVASGTLFIHFPNKNAILADILYEDIETVVQTGFATLPADKSTKDKLLHLASALYTHYLIHRDLSRTLLKNSLFEESKSAGFSGQFDTFIGAITQLIQLGNNQKMLIRPKMPRIWQPHLWRRTFLC